MAHFDIATDLASPLTPTGVTGLFTPAPGDLLAILGVISGGFIDQDSHFSDTQNLGWALDHTEVKAVNADRAFCAFSKTLASAIPMNVTISPPSGSSIVCIVLRISGMAKTGLAAARQDVGIGNQDASGTPLVTFPIAPLTTNPILAFVANGAGPSDPISPPPGLASLVGDFLASPPNTVQAYGADGGFTSQAVQWASPSQAEFCAIAIELDASGSPPSQDVASEFPGIMRGPDFIGIVRQ